jgi:hypothetical protein
MERPGRPEIAAVYLWGMAAFIFALSLRTSQPGVLRADLPGYVWPAGAGIVYLAGALLAAGLSLRMLALLAAMVAVHVAYAALMGLAFDAGATSAASGNPLAAGLMGYPPATLLQASFVVLAGRVIVWPRLRLAASLAGDGGPGGG